ncbi:unnamed protein product [Rotaria sordida]|uniref:Uncharacterized protein n=1 Tax=Rotaria sordida TaxID=392033 RepID=A0A819EAW8_9BILA|nr:unnamed protein product [Rotaria sordida]CAF1001598.1 unnamed protein product [Rotaria sordida]CAF3848549.1 unnamed protein product [Rotaria sordida]CAF3938921.1 unnamed protein product [Rotaria sordida]
MASSLLSTSKGSEYFGHQVYAAVSQKHNDTLTANGSTLVTNDRNSLSIKHLLANPSQIFIRCSTSCESTAFTNTSASIIICLLQLMT